MLSCHIHTITWIEVSSRFTHGWPNLDEIEVFFLRRMDKLLSVRSRMLFSTTKKWDIKAPKDSTDSQLLAHSYGEGADLKRLQTVVLQFCGIPGRGNCENERDHWSTEVWGWGQWTGRAGKRMWWLMFIDNLAGSRINKSGLVCKGFAS